MRTRGRSVGTFLPVALAVAFCLVFTTTASAAPPAVVKISVFNFGSVNIDAAGYGTTVSNMLINSLSADPSLVILERKELEAFLALNDLQQNDDVNNAVNIGTRLALDVVVVGTVEKKGPVITIRANTIQVDKRRSILHSRVAALGDAGLMTEVRKLAEDIRKAIGAHLLGGREEEKASIGVPGNIRKRSSATRVSLSWDPPAGKVAGYEVFRSSAEAGPFARVGQVAAPEYTDEGLARNTTYYYRVRAYDHRGLHGDYSPAIAAETALSPNPPVILSTEPHVRSITLTWSPSPARNEDPLKLKGYKVYRAKVEAGPYREIANILGSDLGLGLDETLDKIMKVPLVDRGLADGESYFYRVTAYNEKGVESDFSRPMKGTTISAVNGLTARGDMVREIELTWNSLDEFFYVRGYYIYRSTAPDTGFLKIKKLDSTEASTKRLRYVDTEGLSDATRYYYRVTAFETPDQETSPSVTVSAVTKGKPPTVSPPRAQGGLVKKVVLTWTPATAEDVEGYVVYRSTTKTDEFRQVKKIRGREAGSFTDEGLDDGATYYYFVNTFNKVDVESAGAPVVSATTKPRPSPPQGLKAESGKARSVPLSWQANPEKDVILYHVSRGSEDGRFEVVDKVKATSWVDRDLKDGRRYAYRVQAEDRDGLLSDPSAVVTATTKNRPRPPRDLSAVQKGDRVELTWQPPGEEDIKGYNVYEKGFFRPEPVSMGVKGLSFSDGRPLKKGKERVYLVTAVDRDDLESDPREVVITGR